MRASASIRALSSSSLHSTSSGFTWPCSGSLGTRAGPHPTSTATTGWAKRWPRPTSWDSKVCAKGDQRTMSASITGALEEAIRFTLPWTAAVAIVLPEDAEPPDLDRRKMLRIPAASEATLEQIESLREEGFEYLIVPAGSREWLKPDLRGRLEQRQRLVMDD